MRWRMAPASSLAVELKGKDQSKTDTSGLTHSARAGSPTSPETAVMERVPNGNAGTDYVVRFTAPEFTSLCPMTGQPISPISSSTTFPATGWWNRSR